MKPNEIREMSSNEMQLKLRELKEELFNLRFQKATGHLENPMRIREVKRDYARIMTILCERERQEGLQNS